MVSTIMYATMSNEELLGAVNEFDAEFESFMDTFVKYFGDVGSLERTFSTSVSMDGRALKDGGYLEQKYRLVRNLYTDIMRYEDWSKNILASKECELKPLIVQYLVASMFLINDLMCGINLGDLQPVRKERAGTIVKVLQSENFTCQVAKEFTGRWETQCKD